MIFGYQGAAIGNMDGKHKSGLLHAIEQGKLETVNFLLNHDANYMIQDDRNQSCIHVAATHNRVTILETLLKVFVYEVQQVICAWS